EANAELKKIKTSKERNASESDALKEMVEDLTEGKIAMTSKNESLQRQLKVSTSEVDSLRAAEEELLMKIRSLQSENTALVKEKQDFHALSSEKDKLEERIESLEAQNTQIDVLKKKIKTLLEEKTNLEEKLVKGSKIANELSTLKQEKMASDIIVKEVKMQNKSLEERLKQFGEVKRHNEEMKSKMKEMENLIEEFSNDKTKNDQMQIKELDDSKTRIQELDNKLIERGNNLEILKTELSKVGEERDNLSKELTDVENRFKIIEEEKSKLDMQIQELDDSKSRIQELDNELIEGENNLEILKTELSKVGEERDNLSKDLTDVNNRFKIIEEEKSKLDMQISKITTENENRLRLMQEEKDNVGIVANEMNTLKTQNKDLLLMVSTLEEESKIAINDVCDLIHLCRRVFPSFVSQVNEIENKDNPNLSSHLNSLKESFNIISEKTDNLDFDKRLHNVEKFLDNFMEKYAKIFVDDKVSLEDTSLAVKNIITSVSEIFNEISSLLNIEISGTFFQKLQDTCDNLITIPSKYVEKVQKQIDDNSLEKTAISENVSSLTSEVSQLRITIQEKSDALKVSIENCDKYQKEKESLETMNTTKESFITELKEKNESLEKELNCESEKKKCAEEHVKSLESQITSGDCKQDEIINNLRQEAATLKAIKEESNDTLKQLQEEVTSLKKDKDEANVIHKQMQSELACEKGRLAHIESELKSENLSLSDTIENMKSQQVEIQEKCSTLESQLEDLNGALERSQEAVEMYQQESQALNLASEACENSLKESEGKRSKLEASLQESSSHCEELLTELNQMNQLIRERGERISRS
ncbi:unnamed protein product, partial [Meganyctiphanes norvegica]